jgi:hypothetical protein
VTPAVNEIPDHLDETGAPCARHPAIAPTNLYQLAMVGSRAPAFHHDCASKLQGLVMALDELTELAEHGEPQLMRAIETALEASRELNALLNLNRALTRPSVKARVALRELVTRGAERVGVSVNGALPESLIVSVGVAPVTHAFALAIDVAAGSGRGRALTVETSASGGAVEISLVTSPVQPTNASDALAIASFVVARDGGRLWCSASGDRMMIRLPAG